MPDYKVNVDPENEIGISVGQMFVAFDKFHDVDKSPITNDQRFVVNLDEDGILWLIESLAKELPEVLHYDAICKIQSLSESRVCENCEFEPAEVGSKFCEICG